MLPGYQVLHQIGQGGQAVVYRAIHEATNRPVALKVLSGGAWLDSRRRGRFDREAEIMASLDHPHIIRIVDRGRTTDAAFYIAMELVEGWPLEDFASDCAANDPNHPHLLLGVLAKVARAVHSAHAAGIIHRDLKPSNIRVDTHGEPRVLDFGLAHHEDGHSRNVTMTGQWVGSIPWFSPEQAVRGEHCATAQTDIYALGVIAFQCLYKSFPYDVTGPMKDVLDRIASAKPDFHAKRDRGKHLSSPDLQAVLSKALSKRPEDRYASALELAEDLDHLANRRRPKNGGRPSPRWMRWLLAILMVSIVLCVAMALQPSPPVPGADLPHFSNAQNMTFVLVRSGSFWMGSPKFELGHRPDEIQHWVTLSKPFWLGTTEVTRQQYAAVMGLPKPPASEATLPATNVSWFDAVTFCHRLSEKDGRTYRLPTEAEWEYSCRLGNPQSVDAILPKRAWTLGNSRGALHPVGSKQADDLGVFDMLGNAQEWCADRAYDYSREPVTDPQGPPPTAELARAIVRGGSAISTWDLCRPATRTTPATTGFAFTGFRVVSDTP
ncbi:MAG TPA: bifunctional serine/threonine-protein kinase/formylglycine-generating enzyme family protein [Roseimicrobium sp.]|nr:bifunctional serine/threonine-protein kinase/formylglycine-generating enzyme family protein [Roseimicrobium sp.]